jgi:hypothetical protein
LIELYNGTCLSFKDSEECLKLLSEAEFKDGMLKTLPEGITVAHKFGEAGPTSEPNFSESAIIYAGKNCYILTVMTKGKDIKKLPLVVSEISQKIYNSIMIYQRLLCSLHFKMQKQKKNVKILESKRY